MLRTTRFTSGGAFVGQRAHRKIAAGLGTIEKEERGRIIKTKAFRLTHDLRRSFARKASAQVSAMASFWGNAPANTSHGPIRATMHVVKENVPLVLTCPSCQGRMRLLAVVKNPRYLAAAGELTDVPGRSPPRAPPYWKSQVLRRQALGDQGHGGDRHDRDHEAA